MGTVDVHILADCSIRVFQVYISFLFKLLIFYSEWMVNQHRDSFASFIGHHDMVSYFSLVENESKARTKFNLMQVSDHKTVMSCKNKHHSKMK